jgi:hypothetical protein
MVLVIIHSQCKRFPYKTHGSHILKYHPNLVLVHAKLALFTKLTLFPRISESFESHPGKAIHFGEHFFKERFLRFLEHSHYADEG